MEGFDSNIYYNLDENLNDTYRIINKISSKSGGRDYKNNCNISLQTPQVSSAQNVLWGSQKLIKESCPNMRVLNETPSHYAWNNFTKRRSIVE